MGGLGSLLAAFPDPAAWPFAALCIDVQLFVGIPYPQNALSPGLVLAGDQWAMDRLQNGAAIHKGSGHSSNDQAGTSPDTEGAREGLLKRAFHQPDCGHRTISSPGARRHRSFRVCLRARPHQQGPISDPFTRHGFRNHASSASQLTASHQVASSLQIDGFLGALADQFECRHCSFSRLTLIYAESTRESIPQTAQRVFGFALS